LSPEFHSVFNYGRSCTIPTIPGEPALDIKGLTFAYSGGASSVLEDVSLRVMPGEKVALVGPNGAGKSTLIKLIAGLERPPSGSIVVYGNAAGACYHRVAYVPQRGDVDWSFPVTVRQVVMMGRYSHLGWLKWPSRTDHDAVERALATMNVAELADRQIGELSGGQQQRVMLARTLAQEAHLLLLDEPLNNLDVPTQELIYGVLDDQAAQGRTLIVSTHDLGVLPLHFTRAIFLDRHVVVDGPVKEVLTARTLLRAYGVHLHPHEGIWDADVAD
jgi:ABC-type Mn2+/Zn2+ transport system ATPase subunit